MSSLDCLVDTVCNFPGIRHYSNKHALVSGKSWVIKRAQKRPIGELYKAELVRRREPVSPDPASTTSSSKPWWHQPPEIVTKSRAKALQFQDPSMRNLCYVQLPVGQCRRFPLLLRRTSTRRAMAAPHERTSSTASPSPPDEVHTSLRNMTAHPVHRGRFPLDAMLTMANSSSLGAPLHSVPPHLIKLLQAPINLPGLGQQSPKPGNSHSSEARGQRAGLFEFPQTTTRTTTPRIDPDRDLAHRADQSLLQVGVSINVLSPVDHRMRGAPTTPNN